MVVGMFLGNTRGEIRRRAVEISARNFTWEEMLTHVQVLDNQAPRSSRPPPSGNLKRSMMQVEESSAVPQLGDEGCNTSGELNTKIAELQSLVAQLENTVKGKAGGSENQSKRKRRQETICYNCDIKGHIARNCRKPKRDQDQGKGLRK